MRELSPLLTSRLLERLLRARHEGSQTLDCSLDLERSLTRVRIEPDAWTWQGRRFDYPTVCKDRTIYHWLDGTFQPLARYSSSLVKLVPTEWGPPTFEIDGIKMLPTARISPYLDAQRKVQLIRPKGKVILDTCGGLGYFAAWCVNESAARIHSYEKNADVIWLRSVNPWSPNAADTLTLTERDVTHAITTMHAASVDAVLHDPPRFGIAGELYSHTFYEQLARVLRRRGTLFHYTGNPNKLTTGRNVPREVAKRLQRVGFDVRSEGDGLLAVLR